ncbi:alpha-L-fucosidase [Flavobacterium flavipallidum]|uniref:alpha-L-fucosidase n=1 Tax=Flavobacterium flavipallidum TaxID=3139140 RepID=A0ABU9HKU2_9FLAO
MKKLFLLFSFLTAFFPVYSQKLVNPPKAFGPLPSEKQLKWHEMESYAFVHFSLNTFTNKEWGYGNESPELFNPSALDANQWAKVVKEAGLKGIILVAKHHDGFCLWPSAFTERSVKNSPWKNGKGDVVRELSKACKKYNLKFGLYLSPWDRNHPAYGKPEYITYFRNQLKELLTNYGDVFEMWFDGANGGDGYYGGANEIRKINTLEYYNWDETYKMIYSLAPKTLVWGIGPSEARWIGNEEGYANATNWSLLRQKDDLAGKVHYTEYMSGHENGEKWVPGEVDVSIRPGWFYHKSEDDKVHTLDEMVDFYYHSVGRNASFLLNIPPDRRGLIHENDIQRLKEYAAVIKADFKTEVLSKAKATADNFRGNNNLYAPKNTNDANKESYWATDDNVTKASILFTFPKPTAFNRLLLKENIKLGQRVKAFTVEAKVDGKWQTIASETTIGYKRILRLARVTATALRITITDAKASIVISNIQAFNAPTFVKMPIIKRDKSGIVTMEAEAETPIYYTLDGSKPSKAATKYTAPFKYDKAVVINAVSINEEGISSAVRNIKYGISKENWKIVSISSGDLQTANKIIDGNPDSVWSFGEDLSQQSQEVVIDLGNLISIKGFTYTPNQAVENPGLISNYELYSSSDGVDWKIQSEGEFSNIKNNPIEQVKLFNAINARYLRFVAKTTVADSKEITIGEISVVE